ncbi:MAG: glycosyltransferase, partial [Planctomycetota bacterium]|nr:glycosyltransferase [Planctomycetota bacterium]
LLTDHGPVVAPRAVANIVTLHDVRFLHGYGGMLRSLYARTRYGRVLRSAAAVLAVGPSLAAEAQARWSLEPNRVVSIPNAVSPTFVPLGTSVRAGALVVSREEPRKARGAAVAAANEAGVPLTIVDTVRDDGVLCARYAAARWLLAPSLLEGYGLTVAEALACGTPVIATDHAAHRDIERLGARGIIFVPAPRQAASGWVWPEAVAALRGPTPTDIRPPPQTWDDAARAIADVILRTH